ncbi:MAG: glycoside hydrolase family 31 protein [Pegethrix bostrychoides GSE-TBD4-15B]|jgi:alpha-glucosidase|uniref:Glycoside hydrolase family 31 protein n=1 Tax=Pegethrix bostrychoides GSE-TBD4-15B TaxID=2839662 RepID=A0A951PEX8_9CYAN|nr:glycoside hydrolase family 31 protein [Pegethrix bostrychoides GSE-TBD4-15B]
MPEFVGQMPQMPLPWTTTKPTSQIEINPQQIQIWSENCQMQISILAENLMRVRLTPKDQFRPRRAWAITPEDTAFAEIKYRVAESSETLEITTAQMQIQLEKASLKLTCFDQANRAFARDLGCCWRANEIAAWKQIEPDEQFYGFGERTGLLSKRGQRLTNWTTDSLDYDTLTDEMYQSIPFFMALRPQVGYGILLNDSRWSQFDMGTQQPETWQMLAQNDELDYYIIYGPQPAQILATYADLTGRMPLPPRWALGYHQCRWSYRSETEVRELAAQFRQRQIPCDVIHLDIDYMNGFRVFTWHPERFANPAQMIGDLKQQGFQIVTIVDPGVKYQPDGHYDVLESGLQQDYFVRHADGRIFHGYVWPDRAVFPDFMRPAVRQWWAEQHRALTEAGVAGIWNDMNEPALNDRPFGDPGVKIPLPLDASQGDVPEGQEQATHRETHNLYGLMMARAAAEALATQRPTQRSFVLTRAGTAGIQRWSAVWTGDNQSRWEYLELSLPMLCNLGLSGVAFVGADIGGFAGDATPELFARWMQVGMLYPMMRAHTTITSRAHEPWVYGEQVERICREYIELRYQLLPYIYSLFWQASTTGAPILRPLLYEFPQDPQVAQIADQVMLGSALMAAPVLRPGVTCRAVYLPAGNWFDWWTGEKLSGGRHILADAPLEKMPLYVRAGAVIPLAPVTQQSQIPAQLRVKIWPGSSEWTLYEDDGDSFDYRDGGFAVTTYRVELTEQQAIVRIDRSGAWLPPQPRRVTVELVGWGEQQFEEDGEHRELRFSQSV